MWKPKRHHVEIRFYNQTLLTGRLLVISYNLTNDRFTNFHIQLESGDIYFKTQIITF